MSNTIKSKVKKQDGQSIQIRRATMRDYTNWIELCVIQPGKAASEAPSDAEAPDAQVWMFGAIATTLPLTIDEILMFTADLSEDEFYDIEYDDCITLCAEIREANSAFLDNMESKGLINRSRPEPSTEPLMTSMPTTLQAGTGGTTPTTTSQGLEEVKLPGL